MAAPLLLAIAAVLAWGTIYETRFGTAAVQRFVYRAWWFQALLGFLALNLALAALSRAPWKRTHLPFVLAHIGIILILIGGIIGGRCGIEGQLIIQEGAAERVLELSTNVLVVHQPNPGVHQVFPTHFETQAWVHEPHAVFPVALEGRNIRLTVDRYYPDAVTEERITDDGTEENPAVHVIIRHLEQQDAVWLFARDPERFGIGWGEAHLLFLEPSTPEQVSQLLQPAQEAPPRRGVLVLRLPAGQAGLEGASRTLEIPVPDEVNRTVPIEGTAYRITFKDYFPDFAITEQGVASRSMEPNNPAVSFTLEGPEGVDPYLLFALHPDIAAMHGWGHKIKADVRYRHAASEALPPNAVAIIRAPSGLPAGQAGLLAAVLTGPAQERQVVDQLEVGVRVPHPWLGYAFELAAAYPRARVTPQITNRSDDVKAEALHLVGQEGEQTADGWLGLRGMVELPLGKEPVRVEYRPAQRELPVTIKLMDFRKIDYPGTQMAAGFESDVQLTDPTRGLILMRKISMNNPLRYRGFSFYQSSYIPGAVETTVLSVRNDPGTPLVYAGFLIVIGGVIAMFVLRSDRGARARRTSRRRSRS